MNIKSPKQILRNLFQKHSVKLENVIYAEKIFIINTVINYLFNNKTYIELEKNKIKIAEYGELINKYLADELDIYWSDGILMVREKENVDRVEGG